MASLARFIRLAIGACAFLLIISASMPSNAQQVNPTASSVKEQQLLQELIEFRDASAFPMSALVFSSSLPAETGENSAMSRCAGSADRHPRHTRSAGDFYLSRGMVRIEGGRSGRTMVRFTAFERFVHWMTATCSSFWRFPD